MSFLSLALGFVSLIWGAERFVSGSSALAGRIGIPSLIVGLTVVAFGTSAPELAVSTSASFVGENEIALGNVLGSNIFNLLCVAGMSSVITTLVVEKSLLKRDWFASIIATVVLLVLMFLDGDVSRFDAVVLLIGFGIIMFLQIQSARQDKVITKQESEHKNPQTKLMITLNIVFGLVGIITGGQLSIYGATGVARMFGLSETLIGLTIVAIGTSLPELVTSLVATKRGESSIAIGNVIGSNLFNVMFILGISCLINPIPVEITAIYDTLVLLIVTVIMYALAKKGKLNRVFGIMLVLMYVAYTLWLIVR